MSRLFAEFLLGRTFNSPPSTLPLIGAERQNARSKRFHQPIRIEDTPVHGIQTHPTPSRTYLKKGKNPGQFRNGRSRVRGIRVLSLCIRDSHHRRGRKSPAPRHLSFPISRKPQQLGGGDRRRTRTPPTKRDEEQIVPSKSQSAWACDVRGNKSLKNKIKNKKKRRRRKEKKRGKKKGEKEKEGDPGTNATAADKSVEARDIPNGSAV